MARQLCVGGGSRGTAQPYTLRIYVPGLRRLYVYKCYIVYYNMSRAHKGAPPITLRLIAAQRAYKWDYDALAMDRFISDNDRAVSPDAPGGNQSSFRARRQIYYYYYYYPTARNTFAMLCSCRPGVVTRPKSKDHLILSPLT